MNNEKQTKEEKVLEIARTACWRKKNIEYFILPIQDYLKKNAKSGNAC